MTDQPPDGDCQCKVGRGVEAYDLDAVDAELTRRWRGEGRERQSLRELAEYYNRRLLDAALHRAGTAPLDGEAANVYRLLTDDDVSSGERTQTRRRLQAAGVDVDAIESRFVSHQTVHTHLTDCLGVTREDEPTDPADRRETTRDRIRALQSRTEAVSEDALTRLAEGDALALGTFDVLVDVTVLCDACGRQHQVGDLLDEGGCDCQRPDSS